MADAGMTDEAYQDWECHGVKCSDVVTYVLARKHLRFQAIDPRVEGKDDGELEVTLWVAHNVIRQI